jgi:hypothetical protein
MIIHALVLLLFSFLKNIYLGFIVYLLVDAFHFIYMRGFHPGHGDLFLAELLCLLDLPFELLPVIIKLQVLLGMNADTTDYSLRVDKNRLNSIPLDWLCDLTLILNLERVK